jgi:hypothetical protein
MEIDHQMLAYYLKQAGSCLVKATHTEDPNLVRIEMQLAGANLIRASHVLEPDDKLAQ